MTTDERGLAGAWRRHQRHDYPDPAPDLAPFIARHWHVSWDYATPYHQLIVPLPNVHLTFGSGGARISGVARGHWTKVLAGRGEVRGVAFRPGAFRAFLGASVSTITGRVLPAEEVFGPLSPPTSTAELEELLRSRSPVLDRGALDAVRAVGLIESSPGLTRVDAVARELGVGVRSLQRLFAEHVGVGPKWVVRRYRLREATDRLAEGGRIAWADLAAELGYADQGHLTRDFTEVFGEPPTTYARRY
ncbi:MULTISPECIES: helix-turn-helix domain-containing protein [Actinosynnema]|uniref:helix-turn-helix domain-containing protein n=1 Tax=Actinosynnema TaxID=40566 RepID=UPI0027E3A251|nr:helix-turn-helix domain-containing protein [Actinosynnema pretiosum]MCP2094452.1 transcriptional regulator, AraC family [Actinosynnema pretiosum]